MTKNDIITKLHNTSKVQSRYPDIVKDNNDYIYDELEVIFVPAFSNQFESMDDHFVMSWESDSAILWLDDEITELKDGWFSFNDGNYGNIEFKFIEA